MNISKRKKIGLWGSVFLFILACLFVGFSLAYFSGSIINDDKDIVKTLDLTMSEKTAKRFYVNDDGNSMSENIGFGSNGTLNNIASFNPGDIIEISLAVKNTGTKSAYVRETASLTIIPDVGVTLIETGVFKIFRSTVELEPANIRSGSSSASLIGTSSLTGISKYETTPIILNGSFGTDYETESEGIDTNTSPQIIKYYIYFDSGATSEYLNVTINVILRVDAITYRNNNLSDWSDTKTLTTEFTL